MAKKKILIIEDEKNILDFMARTLRSNRASDK